jgi:hypothetical protein
VCFSYAVIDLLRTGADTRREFVVCFSYAVIGLLETGTNTRREFVVCFGYHSLVLVIHLLL